MSYLEHEPEKLGNCGCPSCDLYNEYLKAYSDFITRKAYVTFEISNEPSGRSDLDDKMNELQSAGYELAYVIPGRGTYNRIMVMRSVPPPTPNAADIIQELKTRETDAKIAIKDIDDFGPTMGGMQ